MNGIALLQDLLTKPLRQMKPSGISFRSFNDVIIQLQVPPNLTSLPRNFIVKGADQGMLQMGLRSLQHPHCVEDTSGLKDDGRHVEDVVFAPAPPSTMAIPLDAGDIVVTSKSSPAIVLKNNKTQDTRSRKRMQAVRNTSTTTSVEIFVPSLHPTWEGNVLIRAAIYNGVNLAIDLTINIPASGNVEKCYLNVPEFGMRFALQNYPRERTP